MRTIYDFKDIRRLEESTISHELDNGIIICATASLASSMREYYPQYNVVDIHTIISELIPEWDTDAKDLRNYLALRNIVEDYFSEREYDRNLQLSVQRNSADIWNAIRLLEEADVHPYHIPDGVATPIAVFKDIWERMENENEEITNFHNSFKSYYSEPALVLKEIERCIAKVLGKEISIDKSRFYFLGFYFITPIQARMIDVIKNAGIDTAYLNCRDEDYRYVGEIWEKTYAGEYNENSFTNIQPDVHMNNAFGNVLSGIETDIKLDIVKYSSYLEFARSMKEPIESGAEIYTPNLKDCEKILKEYPELFIKKHLLSFPVGQYIYYLHLMWNPFRPDDHLELRYDHVFKCFATGWLEVDSLNGREYLFELSELETYFKGCITFEDWLKRFQQLKEAKKCTDVFEPESETNKKWHQFLGNPFRKLSVYNVKDDTLDEIEALLKKLMADAQLLFSSTEKTKISRHFEKIIAIIESHKDRESIIEDEEAIAQELIDSLKKASTRDVECPLSAVRDAIILLVGGHFDETDSLYQETALFGEQISPLTKIESSMLTNYGQDIYLVLADEFTLPGIPSKLPWPLNDGLLDSLMIREKDTERYVQHMRAIIDNRPLSYRYLFYSFLSNVNEGNHPRIHISWVKNQGNKTVNASPYILLLQPDANKMVDTYTSVNLRKEIEESTIAHVKVDIPKPEDSAPDDIEMDYDLCRYRYLYSYLVNYLPEYKSDFHYSFLLSKLIHAFSTVSEKSRTEITEKLFDLFPFFRRVEHRQAADYTTRIGEATSLVYDFAEYPAERLDIHYIETKCRDFALRNLEEKPLTRKEKEHLCMYCPYTSVCLYKELYQGGE